MTRHIGALTSSRADFGILFALLQRLDADPRIRLTVYMTGMHHSAAHGSTADEVRETSLRIVEIPTEIHDDTPESATVAMGQALAGFARGFALDPPDLLLVLGDRLDMLPGPLAAMTFRIPIAHISGGEATFGVIDDAIRHMVTKMAHLHFVATDVYRRRVIQLGEDPSRVYDVGALGVDIIADFEPMSAVDLEKFINFDLGDRYFVVTYHPVTLDPASTSREVHALIEALDEFPEWKVLCTGVNADPGYGVVRDALEQWGKKAPERVCLVANLGQKRYFSALGRAGAVIGNSSSGIVEAPSFGIPTINVGMRQHGRLRGPSVIDCGSAREDIVRAIRQATSKDFRRIAAAASNPYHKPGTCGKIAEKLATVQLDRLLIKGFFDLPHVEA